MSKWLATKNKYLIASVLAAIIIILITVASIVSQQKDGAGNDLSSAEPSTPDESIYNANNTVSYAPYNQLSSSGQGALLTSITNYDDIVKNLPNSEKSAIYQQISNTLKQNGITQQVNDATIRDNSYMQTISDYERMIYKTTFIVDIPSIKQSYKVQDMYSPMPVEKTQLYDYTTQVICLDEAQLVFGNFNCQDRFTTEGVG